ncbi:3-hydroxypropanoate dehydrogenase [Haloactinospora alba]|uniref:3-hydroxypropanoate dehydrogenase n=1 Tax=Haloactinospora alba TaxID=405555 RepID=A0A543NEZ4_9ACTN|nr:malonic semialdehyde reductase [Haloactinospora alba]TQN30389.1 3-hydroxypropanoate dehydrogenase [Haloactinospora alba]
MSEITEPLELARSAQDLLFREARTANSFSSEPVSDAQIRAIHDLAKYGPTSMNIQPLRVTLLRSAESRERLVPLMMEGNQPKTRTAPLTAILSYDTEFHERAGSFFPSREEGIRNLFGADEQFRTDNARLNSALQAGYFLIGIRAAGLAAGPMTGFDAEAVNKEFFGDGRQRAFVVVNLGRPGPDHPEFERLPRFDFEDVTTEL